jgi:nucleotidyltransferase substrate binding protein (TIGR01987 family)
MIVTTFLANALDELQKNLDLPQSAIARKHPELVGTFRTAAIKSFEYAYELSVRLLRRSLTTMAATPGDIEQLDFRALMRMAAEKGLIDDPLPWFLFREKRNITSHTYDETQALDVLSVMPQFLTKAWYLVDRITRNGHAHS